VRRYGGRAPIFHVFDVERQIDLIHSREVPLSSGGRLVIDQTEALVAIDVNSGKSRSARDSETNAYRTNMEAADEICRQLRLRDLGGLLIHDLIDMYQPNHRKAIEDRFRDNLKRDRAKTTILRISRFGILEMTRQRMRPSMRKSHFMPCSHCDGHGEIKTPESVGADAVRRIGFLLQYDRVDRVEIACSPRVASVLLSGRRRALVQLEDDFGKRVEVRVSEAIPSDRVDFYAYDDRNTDVDIERLPVLQPPTLAVLEAETREGAAATETADDGEERGGRKRRRRRRKPGPADATAIALAGGFDGDDEPEAAEEGPAAGEVGEDGEAKDETRGKKRRSRRRRRRRRGDAEAPADGEGASKDATEPTETETAEAEAHGEAGEKEAPRPAARSIRVHELAKELGVPSREIVARCKADERFPVKNHMSGLSGELADVVRSWFREAEPEERPASRRRRRRRGRGGGGGGGSTGAPDGSGEDEKPASRGRRGRRSRGRSSAKTAEATAAPEPVEPEPAPAATTGKTSRRKKRPSRRKKPAAGEAPGTGDAAPTPKPADSGSTAEVVITRTLTQSRRPLRTRGQPHRVPADHEER
jgi:ribonuclease E